MPTIKSTLYLCSGVPLDPNYSYTLDFDNLQAQTAYFDSMINNVLQENEDYSYIRDSEDIKVQANIDDLLGVNYLFYENANKRYYAFITKKEYVNPTTTRIKFDIDVMQTFMFNYILNECFVEREHQDSWRLNDDENKLLPIFNREAENLEAGTEYVVSTKTVLKPTSTGYDDIYWVCVITSEEMAIQNYNTLNDINYTAYVVGRHTTSVGEIPSGAFTCYIPVTPKLPQSSAYTIKTGNHTAIACATFEDISKLLSDPKVISISVYKQPPFDFSVSNKVITVSTSDSTDATIMLLGTATFNENQYNFGVISIKKVNKDILRYLPILEAPLSLERTIESATNYNAVKDINNEPKLMTSEFSYTQIEVGSHQKQKYNIEDYTDIEDIIGFIFIPQLSVNGGSAIVPLSYENQSKVMAMTLSSNFFGINTVQDSWKEYLANNKNSLETGFLTQAVSAGGSLLFGALGGGLGLAVAGTQTLNFFTSIANQSAKISDIKNAPEQVNKTAIDTLLDTLLRGVDINFVIYTIKPEFKEKIYNYLYHYGYKCNTFKVPNTRSRYYFNYIKTIGATLNTNIDSEWADKLKQVYDNGITIWHYRDPNTFKGVNNYYFENVQVNLLGGNNGE